MSFKKLKSQQFENEEVQKLQDAIQTLLGKFDFIDFLDGGRLEKIAITSGTLKKVEHKLNRNLRGWILLRNRANSVIWDTQDSNPNPNKTLYLNASATSTIDIWVF